MAKKKKTAQPVLIQQNYIAISALIIFLVSAISGLFFGKLWYHKQYATFVEEQANLLYVQDADAGTLTALPDHAATYILEFTDVTPRTLEFSDLPERSMGSMPISEFEETVWNAEGNGFSSDMPTGILMTHNEETGHEDAVVVKLSKMMYDEATNSLQYEVVVIPDRYIEGFQATHDTDFSDFPTELDQPILFIDSTENWLRDWSKQRKEANGESTDSY